LAPVGDDGSEGVFLDRPGGMLNPADNHPIVEVVYRRRAQVGGRVRSVRIRPWGEILTLEAVVADDTGAITIAFLGRRSIAGIVPGGWLTVEGMVGERNEKLVILNPAYDLRPLGG
jgi:hypothetical protein